MSKKVCIFDIDNTLTHGADATAQICCPSGEKDCLVSKYSPNWPPKKSGTSQYALDTIKKCKDNGYEIAVATAETGLQVNPQKQRNKHPFASTRHSSRYRVQAGRHKGGWRRRWDKSGTR